MIFAGTEGYLDELSMEKVSQFEEAFLEYMEAQYSGILEGIAEEKELTDDLRQQLVDALEKFLDTFKEE